jgi:hypothetical protein
MTLLSDPGQKENEHDFRNPDRRKDCQALHLQVGRRMPLQPVQLQELQLLSRRGPRP